MSEADSKWRANVAQNGERVRSEIESEYGSNLRAGVA